MLREAGHRVVDVVVERGCPIADPPSGPCVWRQFPIISFERLIHLLLLPAPVVVDVEVVILLGEAPIVFAGEGVPEGAVEVSGALQHRLQSEPLVVQLLGCAVAVNTLLREVGLHSEKSRLEVRDLERVDAPEVQLDAGLPLDGLHVPEEVFIPRRQDADHSEMRRFQPRLEVGGDVAPLLGNVCCDDDVLHAQGRAHPADVPASQIRHHSPIIGVGDRLHLQLMHHEVQAVAAVASSRERQDAVRPVGTAVWLDQSEKLLLRLGLVAGTIVVAVVAHPVGVELDEGHRLGQDAFRAPAQLRLRMLQHGLLGNTLPEPRNQVLGAVAIVLYVELLGGGDVEDFRFVPYLSHVSRFEHLEGVTLG